MDKLKTRWVDLNRKTLHELWLKISFLSPHVVSPNNFQEKNPWININQIPKINQKTAQNFSIENTSTKKKVSVQMLNS